jgi:hypothetical protein
MMFGMLVAGIGCLLAGLVAIGFGVPVNEFSFGNTLILSGAVTACAGLIILSLWVVVNELKNIAARLESGPASDWKGNAVQLRAATAPSRSAVAEGGAMPDAAYADEAGGDPTALSSAPWLDEAAERDRSRPEPSSPPAMPASKPPRRNLMFSSTSRRERERAEVRGNDLSMAEPLSAAAAPHTAAIDDAPPATFEDAWPRSERPRSADASPRRPMRTSSTSNETPAARPPAGTEGQSSVTVLKSGVVDGMAYSLYSDGSIEAQMPEGMMRFASIDELRAHLDQRP